MKKKLCIGLLLLGSCVFLFSRIPFTDEQKYLSKMRKTIKNLDTKIRFYGKVVDQFDQPIKGAVVHAGVTRYAPFDPMLMAVKDIDEKTDKNGLFEIKTRGHKLMIRNILLDGYGDFWRLNPERGFEYSVLGSAEIAFVPDSKKPIVFVIRERNMPTYLTKVASKINCKRGETSEVSLGVAKDWITSEGKPKSRHGSGKHKDIKVSVANAEDRKSYDVIFSSLDKDSGMILSDELLYEAPEDGYSPEIKISLNTTDDVGDTLKYLYVKARAGAMYSRLKVEFRLARTMGIRISISGLTNPDGSRNLEYDGKFQFEEEGWRKEIDDRRDKEIRKAKQEKRKFYEDAFMKKIHKEKAERDEKEKKENPKWWHKLEDKAKGKD